MIVLVCGGRAYADWSRARQVLDIVHRRYPISLLVHGAAMGADSIADSWAKDRGVQRRAFPMDYMKWGGAAGDIRNGQMLREARPNMVIAFPGGAGTANMIEKARAARVPVLRVAPRNL